MEAENRGLVETSFQIINLSSTHGEACHGIRFHVRNREAGTCGRVIEVKIPFFDTIHFPFDYPAALRTLADKLEEIQKEAETW